MKGMGRVYCTLIYKAINKDKVKVMFFFIIFVVWMKIN